MRFSDLSDVRANINNDSSIEDEQYIQDDWRNVLVNNYNRNH